MQVKMQHTPYTDIHIPADTDWIRVLTEKQKKALRKQLNPNREQPFLKGRKQKR